MGSRTQGPIDSTRANREGRFRFNFRADTAAFYLLSSNRDGIEYFSSPVPTNTEPATSALRIVVYDTSSTAPVTLEARHFVLARPGEDGSRGVLELIVLRNRGRLTRVAPDTMHPSWSAPVPPGTTGLRVSEGDVSPDAVNRRGDSVIVTAPIAPGEKQLAIQYQVPPGRRSLEVPLGGAGVPVNLLVEEPDVRVSGGGLVLADSQLIQGRSFRRWTGLVPANSSVRLLLPAGGGTASWLLPALVIALAVALGLAGARLVVRSDHQSRAAAPSDLLQLLAALDLRYDGRQGETSAQEWTSYQQERARLKAALEATLAVEDGRR